MTKIWLKYGLGQIFFHEKSDLSKAQTDILK